MAVQVSFGDPAFNPLDTYPETEFLDHVIITDFKNLGN